MIVTDLLWCLLAAILLIGIEYVSYLYVKTNNKRIILCVVWLFIIFVLYYISYQILNYVFGFDSISMVIIILFGVSLTVTKTFSTINSGDNNE